MAVSKKRGGRYRKRRKRGLPAALFVALTAVVLSTVVLTYLNRGAPDSENGAPENSENDIPENTVNAAPENTVNAAPENTEIKDKDDCTDETERDCNMEKWSAAALSTLESMTLEEKVCQLFIVRPEQLCGAREAVTQTDAAMQAAVKQKPAGGVVYFAANIKTPDQTFRMIYDIQAASKTPLFIAVDEEGGSVARLGRNPEMGTTAFPPMGEIGAAGDKAAARNVGLTIGNDIKRFGFNLDFAPVADVNSNPKNPVIGKRAFGSSPNLVADMVSACVDGFRESGTLCTLKHFPGHGDTETDSHYGAASSDKTLEELRSCEFLPFQSGISAGADMVMIAHISLPNVTGDDTPATLSYEITTGLLRDALGFDGLIVTDSMSMKAISDRFSSGEAAVRALKAGADIILMPENYIAAVNGVLNALEKGEISEERLDESVYRILYKKFEREIISLTK